MDIVDRIKTIQKDNNLSLSEMSKQLGYSHNQMFRIVHEEVQLTPSFLDKIIEKFNVNEKWLLEGKGKKYSIQPKVSKNKDIRKRLIELRNDEEIKEYAVRINIFPSNYRLIESGKTKLTEKSAEKIAAANSVSVDWLLYGDELSKENPIDKEMINWLNRHPEKRKLIKKWMKKED